MAQGKSGRIVIEVDPDIKRQLYSKLQREGLTLKRWFLHEAQKVLNGDTQLNIGFYDNHEAHEWSPERRDTSIL